MTWSKGLVGHWTLSSLDAKDSSAYDNNGTVNSSPSVVSGQTGNALKFDGSTTYINTNTSLVSGSNGALTVMAWIYSNQVNDGVIWGNWDGNNNIKLSTFEGSIAWYTYDGNTAYGGAPHNDTTVEDNTWYHVAAVYNPSTGYIVYINGEKRNTVNQTTWVEHGLDRFIGARWDNGPNTGTIEHFNGIIDDLRLFNVEVPQSVIQQIIQQRVERRVRQA